MGNDARPRFGKLHLCVGRGRNAGPCSDPDRCGSVPRLPHGANLRRVPFDISGRVGWGLRPLERCRANGGERPQWRRLPRAGSGPRKWLFFSLIPSGIGARAHATFSGMGEFSEELPPDCKAVGRWRLGGKPERALRA